MTIIGWTQIFTFGVAILLFTKPVGLYLHRVFEAHRRPLPRVFGPVERFLHRLCGIDAEVEQDWRQYTVALLAFSAIGILVTYAIQRLQHVLPLNPQRLAAVGPELAFNTAVSFTTNTNWQSYAGESTMSYLTQMAGLAWHNFTSSAAGLGVALAVARGLTRRAGPGGSKTLGNFWVDVIRSIVYVFLPASIIVALVFVGLGMIQNLSPYVELTTLEGGTQVIAMGPVASQEAIKELGTNGGGFFNANSAHPFENPTPLTNFLEMLLIFVIPAGLPYTYGRMAKDQRQGWAIFAAMAVLFFAGVTTAYWAESRGNPAVARLGVSEPLGNMEGKEVRFGVAASSLFATVTTDASCGAVNSMHDSFTPLGGLVPLVNVQLGEVIFGGVGAGLYGMLVMVLLSVFIAGLMVGRTPEYLGKKIEIHEMKMAALVVLIPVLTVLIGTAVALVLPVGQVGIFNAGPQGFSEVLYAFSSAGNNNGSAFAGLGANSVFYNVALGIAMLIARYALIVPVLAMAGSLARKKKVPESAGTLPTHNPLFVAWLIGVIVIVGALSFIPSLALGPIVQQLLLASGRLF